MSEKKEAPYYVVAIGLVLIALFLDIYLIKNGGGNVVDKQVLSDYWTGGFFDWAGILIFNAVTILLAVGILGFWEQNNEQGSAKYNYILFACWAGSLLLMYII